MDSFVNYIADTEQIRWPFLRQQLFDSYLQYYYKML